MRSVHECVARPPEGERRFPLVAHLETVAFGVGEPQNTLEKRLDFLAAWLHDVGKANEKWQWYIENPQSRKGPPHSVYGSVLFAYYADRLMDMWKPAKAKKKRVGPSCSVVVQGSLGSSRAAR